MNVFLEKLAKLQKIPQKNTAADNLKVDSNSKKNAHYISYFLRLGGS
jgi:hypothetical protein